MGISHNAVIVVGLPQNEIEDFDEIREFLEDEHSFESIPYWYDCTADDILFGIVIKQSCRWIEIDPEILQAEIDLAKEHFKQLTGQTAKSYISRKDI